MYFFLSFLLLDDTFALTLTPHSPSLVIAGSPEAGAGERNGSERRRRDRVFRDPAPGENTGGEQRWMVGVMGRGSQKKNKERVRACGFGRASSRF